MTTPKKQELAPVADQPRLLGRLFRRAMVPARLLSERTARRWLLMGCFVGGCIGLCAAIWRNVREDVFAQAEYQVPIAELHLPRSPSWLNERADIRRDVVRDASLEGNLSLLNDRLTIDLARAFALHPWVEEVTSIRKSFPARIDAEVKYRRPVCRVDLPNASYLVDAQAVLLPIDDVRPDALAKLPRLTGVEAPTGLAGAVWNDQRVIGGAEIADVLKDDWSALELKAIAPKALPTRSPRGTDYAFDLITEQDRVICWGFAPEVENADAAALAWKLGEIRDFQRQRTAPVRRDNDPSMTPTRRVEDLTLQRMDRASH
ncbi:MAG: hypothetical protein SGJ19_03180 [Planctomycetia bacterium]|nr:hypothetical protein [Planctomycetia bacterium]